jgi:hypothetical protein
MFCRVSQLFETGNASYSLPTHRATVYLTGVFVRYLLRETKSNFSMNKVIIGIQLFCKQITMDDREVGSARVGVQNLHLSRGELI